MKNWLSLDEIAAQIDHKEYYDRELLVQFEGGAEPVYFVQAPSKRVDPVKAWVDYRNEIVATYPSVGKMPFYVIRGSGTWEECRTVVRTVEILDTAILFHIEHPSPLEWKELRNIRPRIEMPLSTAQKLGISYRPEDVVYS